VRDRGEDTGDITGRGRRKGVMRGRMERADTRLNRIL